MRTKEEILNEWDRKNTLNKLQKDLILMAMEEYAKEAIEEKEKTCQWKILNFPVTYAYERCEPECQQINNSVFRIQHKSDYKYCPYCGRKIERI